MQRCRCLLTTWSIVFSAILAGSGPIGQSPSGGMATPGSPPAEEHLVDVILAEYAAERGITLAPVIGDDAFLRRVYLDLVGLLPPPRRVEEFASNADPDKRVRLVRELLADRHAYAEHWLTFWNDLLRNDYGGTGYIDGGRTQITGWLHAALLENAPYDRFVAELVNPREASAGFANGIVWRGETNASQTRELQFAQSVAQVFLGLNLKCASCHDSFIDDWTLADAYGLAAIYADRPLELHRCDVPTGEMARPAFLFPELGDVDPAAARSERLRQLATLMTSPANTRLTRTLVNRLWAQLMGRGLVEPVDSMDGEAWCVELLEVLARHFADHGHDVKAAVELIATSRAYQRRAVDVATGREGFVFRGPTPRRLTAEQLVDAVWSLTAAAPEVVDTSLAALPRDEARPVRASLVQADPLMRVLGRPNREQIVSRRPDRLTTLEALHLTNGGELAELLRLGAERLSDRASPDAVADEVFLRLVSRRPTPRERAVAIELLGDEPGRDRVADLLWIVLMLPEFQLVP